MSEIKKINGIALCDETARQDLQACVKTVNGVTPDADGNVKVDLIVTLTNDGNNASHNSEQINDHVKNGGAVVLRTDDEQMVSLMACRQNMALFSFTDEAQWNDTWLIYDDNSVEHFSQGFASTISMNERIAAPAKAKVGQTVAVKAVDKNGRPVSWEAVDLPILVVYMRYTEAYAPDERINIPGMVCNYTSSEMIKAAQSGKLVVGYFINQPDDEWVANTAMYPFSPVNTGDNYGLGPYFLYDGQIDAEHANDHIPDGYPEGISFVQDELWVIK